MNALTRDLRKLVEKTEKEAVHYDRFRQKIHLMPPVGFVNLKASFTAFFSILPLMKREV